MEKNIQKNDRYFQYKNFLFRVDENLEIWLINKKNQSISIDYRLKFRLRQIFDVRKPTLSPRAWARNGKLI